MDAEQIRAKAAELEREISAGWDMWARTVRAHPKTCTFISLGVGAVVGMGLPQQAVALVMGLLGLL